MKQNKKIFFTVGPSEIYPTVPRHVTHALEAQVLSLSHRGRWFEDLYSDAQDRLKKLLGVPDGYRVYFLSSATEGMERVIQNTVRDKSGHILTGAFGKKFLEISRELGRETVVASVDTKGEFPKNFPFKGCELIAVTQNDTATGYSIPMREVYRLRKQFPEAIIALDVVSSVPYVELDFKKLDIVLFSLQKGFGLPAGLGVLVVGPRAYRKFEDMQKSGILTGSFHNFSNLEKYHVLNQTYETPNVLGIYLLSCVLRDFEKIGLEVIRRETERKALVLYDFFELSDKCQVIVEDSNYRSKTTIVVEIKGGNKKLLQGLLRKGYVVGCGYGVDKDTQIRIANFPAHRIKDVRGLMREMKDILN